MTADPTASGPGDPPYRVGGSGPDTPETVSVGTGRALVVGYGNPLRRDDGVGWHVANALAADPRAAGLDVIAAHQLSPELAEDLAAASVAVLVDARTDGTPPPAPGRWTVEHVGGAGPGRPAGSEGPGAWSHHCTPDSLASLARRLYGAAAPVVVVGVGVRSMDVGDRPTPAVAAAIPSIVDAVLRLAGAPATVPYPVGEAGHA